MEKLQNLISSNEEWLMSRVLGYAQDLGYSKYTSTLKEAWRISISGLSASLLTALETYRKSPELGPDDDYINNPVTAFGIAEAQKHRERGVPLAMFLGLMKYYRQSYIDLVEKAGFEFEYQEKCCRFIDRFFDRVEIGFCMKWAELSRDKAVEEQQNANLLMTNEKNKYLTIFESIADPAILLDQDNRIENMNQAAVQMLNKGSTPGSQYYRLLQDSPFTREEPDEAAASGSNYYKGLHITSLFPWIKKYLETFARGGQEKSVFEREIKETDNALFFEISLARMQDVSEKFRGIVVTLHDETGYAQTEKALKLALKEAEVQRLNWQAIFRAAPVGIMLMDEDLKIVQINDVIRRDFAGDNRHIIGEQPGNALGCIYSLEDPRGCGYGESCRECLIRKTLLEVARSRETVRGREVLRAFLIDGKEVQFWFSISAEPVTIDGRGHMLVTFENITERKKIEQMKNEIVSVVSHELRTPLTSITGSLGLLRAGAFGDMSEGAVDLIDIAKRNSERLVRLINDILDIDRIESGQSALELRPLEIMPLIEQTVDASRGFAHKFGVSLEIGDRLPEARVVADGDRLVQVVTNLISNAVKFSFPDKAVKVSALHHGGSIRTCVTNHGQGIPEEFQSRIFGKFAQAHSSDAHEKGGAGLGLNICKAIVEKMGGHIGFESEPGASTTFFFDLPEWREQENGPAKKTAAGGRELHD